MSARRPETVDSRGRYVPEAGSVLVPNASGNASARHVHSLTPRRASLMQEPVLVLNATYEPINVTAVRRAMVLLLKGVAQAEEAAQRGSTFLREFPQSAVRDSFAGLSPHSAAEPRAFAEKYFVARPQYLPVLRQDFPELGADSRSRRAAFARRPLVLGKSGGLLLSLQQQQGRSYARRSRAQTGSQAAPIHAAYLAAIDAPDRPSRRTVA